MSEILKETAIEVLSRELKSEASDKKLVFGEGNINAKLVIIGEAPGREEEIVGRPFVGRSGKLLERFAFDEHRSHESASRLS